MPRANRRYILGCGWHITPRWKKKEGLRGVTRRDKLLYYYPSNWLVPMLMSLIILATGCGNGAKTRRFANWKESIRKDTAENDNKITEGIYLANNWVAGRKTILFIHGMGEQEWLCGILEEFGQTHNILEFRYSIYEDLEVNANKLKTEIISIGKECDLIAVGYSFGANILWQSVLNAKAEDKQALSNLDTRLIAPMFGSKYARGHANDLVARIYSALPFTPKVSNLLKALDPEGPIIKSLFKTYSEFVSRVRSAEMFIAKDDSINPNGGVLNILSFLKFYWTEDEIEDFRKFIEDNNVKVISTAGFELYGDAHLDVWRTGEIYKSIAAAGNNPQYTANLPKSRTDDVRSIIHP